MHPIDQKLKFELGHTKTISALVCFFIIQFVYDSHVGISINGDFPDHEFRNLSFDDADAKITAGIVLVEGLDNNDC
jgi:hypothetical protein